MTIPFDGYCVTRCLKARRNKHLLINHKLGGVVNLTCLFRQPVQLFDTFAASNVTKSKLLT